MEKDLAETSNIQEMFTPKKYKVRSGTIDSGKDYEIKITALLALKCCSENLQHFWLATNVDGCGALDDIIMYKENNNGEGVTYFMQLKHQDASKNISKEQFLSTKGDFSLKKYSESYSKLKSLVSVETQKRSIINHLQQINKMVFIIFTNKRMARDFEFLNKIDKAPQLNLIRVGGNTYEFDYEQLASTFDVNVEFVKNLFLFTNQPHIKDMESEIKNAIKNLFGRLLLPGVELTDITQKFIFFIGEWSKGNLNGHYPLTKNHILKKLTELLMTPYMFQLKQTEVNEVNKEENIWHDLITDKDVTVIDKVDDVVERYVNDYIYNIVSRMKLSISVTAINKKLLRVFGDAKNMSVGDIYELLWKTEKIPLLLEINNAKSVKQIQEILRISQGVFRVIILNKTNDRLENLSAINPFTNIMDLNKNYQEQILKLPMKLQGRNFTFENLNIDKELLRLLKVKDIVHILCGKFGIGEEFEHLPEFFVDMSLTRIWLDFTVLEKVQNDIFVVKCESLSKFKTYVYYTLPLEEYQIIHWQHFSRNNFKARVIIFDLSQNLQEMEKLCLTLERPVHIVVWHGNDNLEWIKSSNTIKNIVTYKKPSASTKAGFILAKEAIMSFRGDRKTLVISANPGMGKSILINYFARNAPINFWVLKMNLAKYKEHYKNWAKLSNSKDLQYQLLKQFLQAVVKEQNMLNNIAEVLFEQYLNSKNVLFLLDGFDEIPVSCQIGAKNLIKFINESGHCMCVTTRPSLKTDLESLLDTFAVTLNEFTTQEQMYFLTHYFGKIGGISPLNEKVISFVGTLLEATRKNLNDLDNKFTGVPLQTTLLAQVFADDFKEHLSSGVFQCKYFDLLYLYKQFINEKIKIACRKSESISEDTLNQYKICQSFYALKLLFSANDLKELEINENIKRITTFLPHTMQIIQKDGIIVIDDDSNVSFVHQTYAEYLTAEWLSENINTTHRKTVQNLIKKTFDPRYTVVRNIFDRILAKNCPLHTALINRQVRTVKKIIDSDENAFIRTDKGKRNILHLIAAWGLHHPRPFRKNYITDEMISQDEMTIILNLTLSNRLTFAKDDLLNYTPLDYAISTGSLNVANTICSKFKNPNCCINITEADANYILDYVSEHYSFSLFWVILRCRIKTDFELLLQNNEQTSDLHKAISEGNVENIRSLVSEKNINSKDNSGFTPLHIASKQGLSEIVGLLLDNKAKVNIKDNTGKSPLHWASSQGHADIVSMLVSHGIDTGAKDYSKRNALHYAVIFCPNNQYEIVATLIKASTHAIIKNTVRNKMFRQFSTDVHNLIEAKDEVDMNALHWAVQSGQVHITQLLLSNGADINAQSMNNSTALFFATENNHLDAVKLLLVEDANLNVRDGNNRTPLHWAALNGHINIVKLFLFKQANIEARDDHNQTPLHWAADGNHADVVYLLLTFGANVEATNFKEETPLHRAAGNGHTESVYILLTNGAVVDAKNVNNQTPLQWAAHNGHTGVVDLLITNGANVEAKNFNNQTALHWAACNGHTDIVNILLYRNANGDAKANNNLTPLHCAAGNGHTDIVNSLLMYGANVEAKQSNNRTALHRAAGNGYTEIVDLLLTSGANVKATDNKRRTPLHWAAYHGHRDIINLLLSKGADIEAKDLNNQTPLHWAVFGGFTYIVSLLLCHGANANAENDYYQTPLHFAVVDNHTEIANLLLINGARV